MHISIPTPFNPPPHFPFCKHKFKTQFLKNNNTRGKKEGLNKSRTEEQNQTPQKVQDPIFENLMKQELITQKHIEIRKNI